MRNVVFREKEEIIAALDNLATNRGTDRSALIRKCIRRVLQLIPVTKEVVTK